MNYKLNGSVPAAGLNVVTGSRLTLFNHVLGLIPCRGKSLSGGVIAILCGKVIKQTVGWDQVTVAITLNDIAHRFGSLLQQLLVSKCGVGIATNLLRPFLGFRNDAPGVTQGLIQASFGLFMDILGFFNCHRALVGGSIFRLFQQIVRFRPQAGRLFQSIRKLALSLGFCVTEFFVFPEWFKIFDGFGNQCVRGLLNFARFRFVMLPNTLCLLLHLGKLLVNKLLSFDNRGLRLLLPRCNFLFGGFLGFSNGRLRLVLSVEHIVFQTFVFYEKKNYETQGQRKKNGEENGHNDGLV